MKRFVTLILVGLVFSSCQEASEVTPALEADPAPVAEADSAVLEQAASCLKDRQGPRHHTYAFDIFGPHEKEAVYEQHQVLGNLRSLEAEHGKRAPQSVCQRVYLELALASARRRMEHLTPEQRAADPRSLRLAGHTVKFAERLEETVARLEGWLAK